MSEPPPRSVVVGGRELPRSPHGEPGHWWYDAATATVVVSLPRVDLRRFTEVEVVRASRRSRSDAEALLDGYPGLARRLDEVSASTRTLLQEDNRRIVGLSQAVDRISRDPSTIVAELTSVREGIEGLDDLLDRYVVRWRETEYLNPLDPPVASPTLEAARRLLSTTLAQFA